jgi:hypothetical protein
MSRVEPWRSEYHRPALGDQMAQQQASVTITLTDGISEPLSRIQAQFDALGQARAQTRHQTGAAVTLKRKKLLLAGVAALSVLSASALACAPARSCWMPAYVKSWEVDEQNYTAVPLLTSGQRGAPLELRGLFQAFLNQVTR